MKILKATSKPGQALLEYAAILALVMVTILLVLTLTGTSIASVFCNIVGKLNPSAGTSCSVYISTDFNNMSNWMNVLGTPNWSVTNGVVKMVGGDQRMINKTPLPSNYTVTLDPAQLLSGDGFGIMFRQSPSGSSYSGYDFQIDPGLGNQFVFRRYDQNGTELSTPLASVAAPANFNWNAPHSVQVVVHGSNFQAYVDGIKVLTAIDNTYQTGQVGLRTWDSTTATFGHLTVTPP